jgi:hypothetical protein
VHDFNNFGVDDKFCVERIHTKRRAHNLVTIDLLRSGYGTGRCYNIYIYIYENGLFYRAQPNKIVSARIRLWAQNSQGLSHSCSCCKHNMYFDKLKLVMIYKSLCPRCFGRWLPIDYVARMALNVFESWMMIIDVHFKS